MIYMIIVGRLNADGAALICIHHHLILLSIVVVVVFIVENILYSSPLPSDACFP